MGGWAGARLMGRAGWAAGGRGGGVLGLARGRRRGAGVGAESTSNAFTAEHAVRTANGATDLNDNGAVDGDDFAAWTAEWDSGALVGRVIMSVPDGADAKRPGNVRGAMAAADALLSGKVSGGSGQTGRVRLGGVRHLNCIFESRTRNDGLRCCTENQGGLSWSELACADACNQCWDSRNDPTRNPSDWGKNDSSCLGNCWRFATCSPIDPGVQPRIEPPGLLRHNRGCYTCEDLRAAVRTADVLNAASDGSCPSIAYRIALMVSPLTSRHVCDCYFYRQNRDGTWRERGGCGPVNGPHLDPELVFRTRQKRPTPRRDPSSLLWCGHMCWPFNVQVSAD
jgi:hypothetical protein